MSNDEGQAERSRKFWLSNANGIFGTVEGNWRERGIGCAAKVSSQAGNPRICLEMSVSTPFLAFDARIKCKRRMTIPTFQTGCKKSATANCQTMSSGRQSLKRLQTQCVFRMGY
jgi:hypothetical protein